MRNPTQSSPLSLVEAHAFETRVSTPKQGFLTPRTQSQTQKHRSRTRGPACAAPATTVLQQASMAKAANWMRPSAIPTPQKARTRCPRSSGHSAAGHSTRQVPRILSHERCPGARQCYKLDEAPWPKRPSVARQSEDGRHQGRRHCEETLADPIRDRTEPETCQRKAQPQGKNSTELNRRHLWSHGADELRLHARAIPPDGFWSRSKTSVAIQRRMLHETGALLRLAPGNPRARPRAG